MVVLGSLRGRCFASQDTMGPFIEWSFHYEKSLHTTKSSQMQVTGFVTVVHSLRDAVQYQTESSSNNPWKGLLTIVLISRGEFLIDVSVRVLSQKETFFSFWLS